MPSWLRAIVEYRFPSSIDPYTGKQIKDMGHVLAKKGLTRHKQAIVSEHIHLISENPKGMFVMDQGNIDQLSLPIGRKGRVHPLVRQSAKTKTWLLSPLIGWEGCVLWQQHCQKGAWLSTNRTVTPSCEFGSLLTFCYLWLSQSLLSFMFSKMSSIKFCGFSWVGDCFFLCQWI